MDQDTGCAISGATAGFVLLCVMIAGGLWGCPQYNVYSSRMHGEAELAQATYSRQVRVREAQAQLDAASLLASAEVARARGVAQANTIIASSFENPGPGVDRYLRWRYIEMLQETANSPNRQTIYIPTEAGLPILEANRSAQQ